MKKLVLLFVSFFLVACSTFVPLKAKDEFVSDSIEAHTNMRNVPDACEVIRTDIFKEIVFPEHEGERFLGESYMWNQIGYKYKTV